MTRRLLDYGESAVLLECDDLAEALSLVGPVREQLEPVVEVVPGARTLLLRLAAPLTGGQREQLLTLPGSPPEADDRPPVAVPVRYDGDDLAEVAELTGLSPDEVVQAHTGQLWTVGFCGFAPGFGYLRGEDDRLRVPRRQTPRTRVPAGAVALADDWSAIYPRSGPGGWQLIGRTELALWDLDRDPPALLQPGLRLRFEAL
ncbi:allophanate hydrolase subunit 1 [uncultured Friedmanniella sp.]|uniref:5-oxoprolinase subunit B family protein n=1 Tax=uncultured Friedmanniella sp. TaxID=335381 RepID=UPI0035CA7F6A